MSDEYQHLRAEIKELHQYSELKENQIDRMAEAIYQQSGRIIKLEEVLEKLRLEVSRASMLYPSDLALMQETINSVLPAQQEAGS